MGLKIIKQNISSFQIQIASRANGKKKYSGKLVINVTMKNANLHIFYFNFKDLR